MHDYSFPVKKGLLRLPPCEHTKNGVFQTPYSVLRTVVAIRAWREGWSFSARLNIHQQSTLFGGPGDGEDVCQSGQVLWEGGFKLCRYHRSCRECTRNMHTCSCTVDIHPEIPQHVYPVRSVPAHKADVLPSTHTDSGFEQTLCLGRSRV